MFNFLRTRFVSMQSTHMSMCTNKEHSIRICSFCKVYHLKLPRPMRNILLRHYATTNMLELNAALKKKIKYRSKKYAELLEVRNQKTNNTRAAVQKLNSFHMSTLLEQPDITLDKLHKITPKVSTKDINTKKTKQQNFKDKTDIVPSNIFKECNQYLYDTTEFLEDLKQSGMNDDTLLIKDSSFLNTLQQAISKIDNKSVKQNANLQIKYEKVTNIPGLIPFTKEDFDDSLSNHNLISQILAYMDVYIQTGMLQKAEKMLTLKQLKHNEINIKLYNMLMDAYVSRNMQLALFSMYNEMKAHSVRPNAETYTLLFHMGAKIKNRKQQAEILTKLIADMKSEGISFDDMMNTIMNTTRRNNVLQCIRLVDPKYQTQYRDIDNVQYCKLLQKLTVDSKFESPAKGILTMNELQNMLHTQINMERQGKLEVKSIALFDENPDTKQEAINLIAKLKKTWKSAVTEAFERNLDSLKEHDIRLKSEFKILYPFLQVLPKEEYVDIILYELNRLIKGSATYSEYTSILHYNLGNSIYKKYEFKRKLKAGVVENLIEIYKEYLNWYLQTNPADKSINARVKWQQLVQKANKSGVYSDLEVPAWPRHILLNIGKFLYNIILNNVRISPKPNAPDIPALYLLYRHIEGRPNYIMAEVIKPHPFLHKLYEDAGRETLVFDTVLLPTCCPPRPWVDINIGGFLISKTNFARDIRDTKITFMHLLRNSSKQLYPVFDSLNQLGSIPWKINEPILDILIKIFQKGGSEELNVPQSPSILPSLSEIIKKETNNSKLLQLALQLKRKRNEMYSLWCDCLYKLSLANYFRDKIFWLPHNLDFRGRAYPIPPHLTHLSSDLSRSLLMFAQGKPLGPKGLDWLKIHTINLTGLKKKESTSKRLEYANEVLDLIIDSARNPLTGKMWWNKSDEPWQTLAACKEIDNALQSPNVEEYVSHFPIHQDGSCNGLQHYAALGRDQIGAESVNLYPSNTPQDVYSVVVSMVEQFRKIDAEAGNEVAKVLEGFIIRKVIKQTVMTTVYGVTKFGARIQIARQLNDLKDFDQKFTWSASLYLVERTFKALRTMFKSAKEIQDWFTECSRVISIRCNQYVQWVTPLGLPVLQPYFKRDKSIKGKIVKKPDTLKQKNAFPPNFIHSLDSCHMMLTSLHCEQAGITFVSVHDCFWTHPCSVNIMSKICREQFVALHNEPILEDLSIFFKKRYEKHFIMEGIVQPRNKDLCLEVFEKLPKKGKFDINNVLSSEYFFS